MFGQVLMLNISIWTQICKISKKVKFQNFGLITVLLSGDDIFWFESETKSSYWV